MTKTSFTIVLKSGAQQECALSLLLFRLFTDELRGQILLEFHLEFPEMQRNFFGQRVVNHWNLLTLPSVEARSLGEFKAENHRYLNSQGIKCYGEKSGEWGFE